MRRYRDAIANDKGQKAAQLVYILCPDISRNASDRKYLGHTYHNKWGSGVVVLRPGGDEGALKIVIANFRVL